MNRSFLFLASFLLIAVPGCTTLGEQVMTPSIAVETSDYFQFVIEPSVVPEGKTMNCRLQGDQEKDGFSAAVRNFVNSSKNRHIHSGVSIEYEGAGGEVKHTIPVITVNSRNKGKKCEITSSTEIYMTPLLLAGSHRDTTFNVMVVEKTDEKLDDSVIDGVTSALASMATYSGVPEGIANAFGEGASDQLQKHTSFTPSTTAKFNLGIGPGQTRSKNLSLIDLNTKSGRLSANVNAGFQPIGSAISPMIGKVPDLGSIGNPRVVMNWKVGGTKLSEVVDIATDGDWTKYRATNELKSLNAICRNVSQQLFAKGFSSADSTALTWIMTRTHPDAAAVEAMQRPACLTGEGQEAELARFGIALPRLRQTSLDEAKEVISAGGARLRSFFAAESSYELEAHANVLFGYDDEYARPPPLVSDYDKLIFSRSGPVNTSVEWDIYLDKRPVRLQCLSVVSGSESEGAVGLAIATNLSGAEIPIQMSFSSQLPGKRAHITSISVLMGVRRDAALIKMRDDWGTRDHCETSDDHPEVIFGQESDQVIFE